MNTFAIVNRINKKLEIISTSWNLISTVHFIINKEFMHRGKKIWKSIFVSHISVVDFRLYNVVPKEDLRISVRGSSRILFFSVLIQRMKKRS